MTDAREMLKQGQLSNAIQQLTQDLKAKPTDVAARIFLFELLCFSGDLERAGKQLDIVGHQSLEMQVGTGIYQQILAAEKTRRTVFMEGTLPSFLTPPTENLNLYLEALKLIREHEAAKARSSLEKAISAQPVLVGQADGKPFEGFMDADPFLGPFLELIAADRYSWLPYEEIRHIELKKPVYLRDMIWQQAKIEARAGDVGEVFLPVLYPGTHTCENEVIKLGRMTDWIDVGENLVRGVGQRLFLIDGTERAMLEISEITFSEETA
jgi:type VI secretion system protein ImpE